MRAIIKATAPDGITTLSLSGNGASTCLSSSPPPMAFDALEHVGVNLTGAWLMRGMTSPAQLRWTPVYAMVLSSNQFSLKSCV